MKKLLFSILFLFCITVSCAFASTAVEFTIDSTDYATQTKSSVTKNTIQAAPFIKNDRTMVPVRALCEAFGSNVSWDDATRTVTITKGSEEAPLANITVSLVIGSDKIVVNGEEKTIDCPAEIVNNITFIPLRAVSENLGYYVYYVESTRQILIDELPPVITANGIDVPYSTFKTVYLLNSAGVTDDNKVYLAHEVYSYLKDIYTMYSNAVENHAVLSTEDKAYITEQSELFKADEEISSVILSSAYTKMAHDFQLASVNAENIMASTDSADEFEIAEFYNANFVCAKHVLISIDDNRTEEDALKLANEVYDRALSGEDFDMLVTQYGEDPGMVDNTTGYVFTKGQMVAEFEETTYALAYGEVSAPVKTAYGYHVILRMPLPNDAATLTSIKQEYASAAYSAALTQIYSTAEVSENYAADMAYLLL